MPAQITAHADKIVFSVSAEERSCKTCVEHIKQLLDCCKEREVLWSQIFKGVRYFKLLVCGNLLVDFVSLYLSKLYQLVVLGLYSVQVTLRLQVFTLKILSPFLLFQVVD